MKQLKFSLAVLLACAAGLSHADKFEEGVKAYEAGDYKTAVNILRPLAEQGDAKAQYNLGLAYANGKGVLQNDPEAAKWYRKAAEQGYAKAQYNLGVSYTNGHGVPQNNVLAYMLFSLAATDGDKKAVHKRDTIQKMMTPAEIAKGQALTAQWKPGTPLPTSY